METNNLNVLSDKEMRELYEEMKADEYLNSPEFYEMDIIDAVV